jgi:hypothetical protein
MVVSGTVLTAFHDELMKLGQGAAVPEEKLTKYRFKQMLRDAPVVIGATGLGWGLGRTFADTVARKATRDPKLQAKIVKYGPATTAVMGTVLAATLAAQRRALKRRRDLAEQRGHKRRAAK